MTPNDIEILIHYYTCARPHPRKDAPAVNESIEQFLKNDIFKKDSGQAGSGYKLTDKGKAWLQMILNTPYPKRVWIDDKDNIILR